MNINNEEVTMIKFKEQVKLQQISEDAWIVNDDTKRVGILHKTIQDKFK